MVEPGSIDNATGSSPPPALAIVFLSGTRRGETIRIAASELTLGTSPTADIRIPAPADQAEWEDYAHLVRRGQTYELRSEPGHPVWVNGEPVEQMVLASGDVLEVGAGAVLRFRIYPPGSPAYKQMVEAFSDCLECARRTSSNPIVRAATLISQAPRELMTQTAPAFRLLASLVTLLILTTVGLTIHSRSLQKRLQSQSERITGIAKLLERSEMEALKPADLAAIRVELGDELNAAAQRLQALEDRSQAARTIIEEASRSVVFLQGSFGFADAASGELLRFVARAPDDGAPSVEPPVSLRGNGRLVESFYTGTGFVVSTTGLLMTNRHVAIPWDYQEPAQALIRQGLVPVMLGFVGYLPDRAEPFEVEFFTASESADVALLQIKDDVPLPPQLELRRSTPTPGEEVIVLGYPTGMRALLARTDPAFVTTLSRDPQLDFWAMARKLAEGGHIGPLASRGIVGQVSPAAIVYDAETTQGGSGGPVLAFDGSVVAVNAAVLPEFGGSNMGVPAAHGLKILGNGSTP